MIESMPQYLSFYDYCHVVRTLLTEYDNMMKEC